MTLKITDPESFLRNLVLKKGRSDLEGVYLAGVNVMASSTEDYNYDVDSNLVNREIDSLISRNSESWNQLLVNTRMHDRELVHNISFFKSGEEVTVHFITEDHDLSALVFIPKLNVFEFASTVTFYQALTKFVSEFAGKTPTTVRFTIGISMIYWEDMVEHGEAREVEVGW